MKKATLFAAIAVLLACALANPAQAQFHNKGVYLGPNLTLATTPTGFGADIEFGVSPNIGIGGMVRYWGQSETYYGYSWSWSVIIPQLTGSYHFMPDNQLDPYLGARLGYGIYSYSTNVPTVSGYTGYYGKSDVYLTGAAGLRYFFTPRISANGSIEFHLAGYDFVGGTGIVIGVDFTL